MKILLIIISAILIQGCILQYDSLEYYSEGYNPNNSSLPVDGYYFKSSDSTFLENWPNAVITMEFYENGTFRFGSNVENIDSLDKWICNKHGERRFRYGPFGFYTIRNDTILTEYIATDPMGDHKARRLDFKAIQTGEGIRIIERNGEINEENWSFHKNTCMPDSIQNWLMNHRKYKLKTYANTR
jgi:hypothetical protein